MNRWAIRSVILSHGVLFYWSVLAVGSYGGAAYSYSNLLIVLSGGWVLGQNTSEPVLMYALQMLFTILNDIICLSKYVDNDTLTNDDHSDYTFSVSMAIINLILKPVYLFVIFKEFEQRGGDIGGGGDDEYAYEDVQPRQSPSKGHHHYVATMPGAVAKTLTGDDDGDTSSYQTR